MTIRRLATTTVCALGALVSPSLASAQELRGVVGPGFTIRVTDERGMPVTNLSPGTYTIRVEDLSPDHNFHLQGPGVNRATGVEETGTETWTVELREGRYTFVCDPHDSTMSGSFTVGNPPAQAPRPATPAANRLVASVGPGSSISLRTAAGARVTKLAAGAYTIVVRDRSRAHNFRLSGPGVDRRTTVRATGTTTWRVTLRRGTYRFVCTPHARTMRGSFRVR